MNTSVFRFFDFSGESRRMQRPLSAEQTASLIRKLCQNVSPPLAIVLGSGFGGVADQIERLAEISYAELPGFPEPTTAGHPGFLIVARLSKMPVLLLNGRSHFYEGRSMAEVTFPIRVLAALGVRDVLLTNAAGGINPKFRPGDFMVITDHINMIPESPLRGLEGTQKFLDLTRVYDAVLARQLHRAARGCGARLHKGVYLAVSGPSYETPAEIRTYAKWGADAIGMSTAPEAIVARFCGLRVAGLSCITNAAAGTGKTLLSHVDVLNVGKKFGRAAEKLLNNFATAYGD
jgi:purine-nucleoside phosphorylase